MPCLLNCVNQAVGYKSSGYKISGNREGCVVVLLHSSLSSSSQWLSLVKLLQPHFLCINIDLLGYGAASQVVDPDNYTLDTEVDRVMDIVNSETGEAKFHLVGHSFGGAIGLRLARQVGHRLLSLVMYEPVAFHLLDKQGDGYKEIMAVTAALQGNSATEDARTFVDYWNHPGFFDTMPGKVQQLFAVKMDKVMLDFKGLIGQSYTLDDCDLTNCRVLVVEGKSSRLSAKTLVRQLVVQLPNAEHQVFDGGHMAPLTNDGVAQLIAGFLLY